MKRFLVVMALLMLVNGGIASTQGNIGINDVNTLEHGVNT